ncbi:unnamed protein product [Trifolium pratense]|uniref:Uncharacterized protein n=1 Tax=Trifolium pratense TaxID=57577 RepID=A0ACB0MF62_TRIPR|nr:unnamed protein product [Trifolium pratense]
MPLVLSRIDHVHNPNRPPILFFYLYYLSHSISLLFSSSYCNCTTLSTLSRSVLLIKIGSDVKRGFKIRTDRTKESISSKDDLIWAGRKVMINQNVILNQSWFALKYFFWHDEKC